MRKILLITAVLANWPLVTFAEDKCPEPVLQITTDIKGKIEGELNTFLKLGKINVAGDIQTITTDVLSKYPNADRLALEQNTLSLLCNKVLPSDEFSSEFKQKIIEKLIDKITGENKDIQWKKYTRNFSTQNPDEDVSDRILSAPSYISVAYPSDWNVSEQSEISGGDTVISPDGTSPLADYDISINLSYGEGNIHGLITDSSLSEQLEDSTIPISPSQDDYIQMYKSIYDPVFDQEAGSSIQHQYVPYEIKIENGGDQENQTVVLNAYQHNGKYYLEFAYAAPVWGMSAGDERWDIGIIDFTCTSPPILLSLCKRIISRVKIGAESALGD